MAMACRMRGTRRISRASPKRTERQDDYDGDGLTNLEEWKRGTNPKDADSDYDGRSDAMEVADGTNPTNDTSAKQVRLARWTFETAQSRHGKRSPAAGDDHADHPPCGRQAGSEARVEYNRQSPQLEAVAPHPTFATEMPRQAECPISTTSEARCGSGSSRRGLSAPGTTTGGPGTSAADPRVRHLDQPAVDRLLGMGHRRHRKQSHLRHPGRRRHGMNNIGHPISWTAGQWYQVTLVYSPTGSKLYVNGTTTTPSTGSGVTYLPPPPIRAQGFLLGTDRKRKPAFGRGHR